MKFKKHVLFIITLLVIIFSCYVHYLKSKVDFSCTGEYRSEIIFPETKILNISNISISVSNNRIIYFSIDGVITHNDTNSHLSREIWFSYEPIHHSTGLFRIKPIRMNVNDTDSVKSQDVNYFILGAESNGRTIRIWKLSDSVILIGNAFSPIMSCILSR